MTNQLFKDRATMDRLCSGPLGPYTDPFAVRLSQQGYAKYTIKYRIRLVGALSRWMCRGGLNVTDLDERNTNKFRRYLRKKRSIRAEDIPTLRSFLEYLRQSGVIAAPTPEIDNSESALVERDFANYLAQERRLSPETLVTYLPVVQRFLRELFGTRPILLGGIDHRDISGFVVRQTHNLSRGRAKLTVTALRSFFRFLYLRGDICTELAAAVPTVASWRFATLPKWIPPEQIELLLSSCVQSTTTGLRNYAILLLLARLGLRSAEVVNLTLDDIDWETGELTVAGKSHRQDRLPLPKDVGEALARYLRDGRPRCSTRRVFVRMRAPLHGFVSSGAIYSMVRRAFDFAGIHSAQKGPHVLRHSLATNMLRKGASLSEIGEVLRHQSLNTTQIYAKVDLEALRRIAQPWPGGKQ